MIPTLYGIASRMYQIVRPVRDLAYRRFVRRFPCVGCGTTRRWREAMHTGPHGLGQKASDMDCLPGCSDCHRELHAIGPVKFQQKHRIDFPKLTAYFQRLYQIETEGRGHPVDRFREESAADLERNYRRRHDGPPPAPVEAPALEVDTPEVPITCAVLIEIYDSSATVGELCTRAAAHKAQCVECQLRKGPGKETTGGKQDNARWRA